MFALKGRRASVLPATDGSQDELKKKVWHIPTLAVGV
jgi:hypothetical protein